jgi:hypothetical protein
MTTSIQARAIRAAFGALVAGFTPPALADASIHSGPLRTIGAIDSVECTVTNVAEKPLDEVRVRIRSTNFGTVVSDVTCQDLAQGSECRASFPVSGAATVVRLMCSADASGKKDALRGTFQRWSPTGQSGELAIELR